MPVHLHFRGTGAYEVGPALADWESPPSLTFPSVRAFKAAAAAQGLAALLYEGPVALFAGAAPGRANFWADEEELVWALAGEHTDDPEDGTTWPPGYALLQFLVFWRQALNEDGAYLELVHT